jgi:hypothetical protein
MIIAEFVVLDSAKVKPSAAYLRGATANLVKDEENAK